MTDSSATKDPTKSADGTAGEMTSDHNMHCDIWQKGEQFCLDLGTLLNSYGVSIKSVSYDTVAIMNCEPTKHGSPFVGCLSVSADGKFTLTGLWPG